MKYTNTHGRRAVWMLEFWSWVFGKCWVGHKPSSNVKHIPVRRLNILYKENSFLLRNNLKNVTSIIYLRLRWRFSLKENCDLFRPCNILISKTNFVAWIIRKCVDIPIADWISFSMMGYPSFGHKISGMLSLFEQFLHYCL